MPPKTNHRRVRERNQRRGILRLFGKGRPVAEIAKRVGTSERVVERVLEAAGINALVSEEQRKKTSRR